MLTFFGRLWKGRTRNLLYVRWGEDLVGDTGVQKKMIKAIRAEVGPLTKKEGGNQETAQRLATWVSGFVGVQTRHSILYKGSRVTWKERNGHGWGGGLARFRGA